MGWELKNKQILILPIIAIFVSILSFLPQDAHATSHELQVGDANGACEAIGGTWISGSNQCNIISLVINAGDILTVDSGVTLQDGLNNGHLYNIDNEGTINNSGTITVYLGGWMTNGGIINNNSGGTIFNYNNSLGLSNGGNINNSGTINNIGYIPNSGRITNNAGGVIDNNSGGIINDFSQLVNNGGTIINSATITNLSNYPIVNNGTITNSGTFSITQAGLNNNAILSNDGTLTISFPYSFNNNGNITNTGTIANGGVLTNGVKGTINNGVLNNGFFTNSGTITNYGNFFDKYGGFVNNGNIVTSGTFTFSNGALFDNSGTIKNTGSITNNFSTLNNHPGGQIINFGNVKNTNNGIIINSGAIGLNSGDTITFDGPSTYSGSLSNSGTVTMNSGSTITLGYGTQLNINSGTFSIPSGVTLFIYPKSSLNINSVGILSNSGTLIFSGKINNSGTLNNNGIANELCGAIFTGNPATGNPIINSCDPTSMTATPNPSSAALSSTITFDATVTDTSSTSTAPNGQVSWSDGGAGGHFSATSCSLGASSTSVSSCIISYTTSTSTGSVTINGTYSGDSTHKKSSDTSSLSVTLRTTTTTVTPNPSSVVIGNKIIFHAKVADTSSGTKSIPTGTVSWSDGGAGGIFNSSTCTLVSAPASTSTCNITYTPPPNSGPVTINGTYSGDSSHRTSSGNSALIVNLRTTATTVTPNPSSVVIGNKITFTGKVSDSNIGTKTVPTGTLTWNDGSMGGTFTVNGINTNTCSLSSITSTASSCKAVYTPASNVTGGTTITITASYSADATHKTSTGTSALTVLRATTTVLSPSSATILHGTNQIIKATVTDTTSSGTKTAPTGTVSWAASLSGGSFSSGTCTLAPISSSQSSCQVTYTAPSTTGIVTITGSYVGDSSHAKSSSKSTLTVT